MAFHTLRAFAMGMMPSFQRQLCQARRQQGQCTVKYDTESTNLDKHQFRGNGERAGRADFHVRHGACVRQFIEVAQKLPEKWSTNGDGSALTEQ